jgi:hypothetical protein
MLPMSALQLGDPVVLLILMEADDRTPHLYLLAASSTLDLWALHSIPFA